MDAALQGTAAAEAMRETQRELAESRNHHHISPLEELYPLYMGDKPQQTYGDAAKMLWELHGAAGSQRPANAFTVIDLHIPENNVASLIEQTVASISHLERPGLLSGQGRWGAVAPHRLNQYSCTMTCGMADDDGLVLRAEPGISAIMEQILDGLETESGGAMRRAASSHYTKAQQKFLVISGAGSAAAKGHRLRVDVKGHHDRLETQVCPEEPYRANSRLILSLAEKRASRSWICIPEPELCGGETPPLYRSSEMQTGLCYLSQRANLDCVHAVASRDEAEGKRFVRTVDMWVDQALTEEEQSRFVLKAAQGACRGAKPDEAFGL